MQYAEILLNRTRNGTVDTYYMNGRLKTRWNLQDGKPQGSITSYYENGEILYIDHYEEGKKMSRKKYDPDGKLEFEQSYDYAGNSVQELNTTSIVPAPADSPA